MDKARAWLADNGYDEKMGARPMQRLIQDEIKQKLAESILFGELAKEGGIAKVSIKKEKLILSFCLMKQKSLLPSLGLFFSKSYASLREIIRRHFYLLLCLQLKSEYSFFSFFLKYAQL